MINTLSYPTLLQPFERMIFVENLHNTYTDYEKKELLDILFCIIKFDDNSVVKHEVVFLFGMLHDYLKQFEDEITKELIFVCQHEQSIVLHHEIIETFGHFTNDLAIEFVEKSLTSDNNDILDTAKISKGRQAYEISKKKQPE